MLAYLVRDICIYQFPKISEWIMVNNKLIKISIANVVLNSLCIIGLSSIGNVITLRMHLVIKHGSYILVRWLQNAWENMYVYLEYNILEYWNIEITKINYCFYVEEFTA